MNNIPLSLYIHIPWCARKCPYCDFNSHSLRGELPEDDYIARLLCDLQEHRTHIQQRVIHSIFIGGGTPSLLSVNAIQKLFRGLHQLLEIPKHTEITIEANPGASEQERFYGFYEAGINRLSLGIQSWQNDKLQALGRIHNSAQAQQAVIMAKKSGFTNFNLDIMYGLPGQTLENALLDLQMTLECQPQHISWYQLTMEPNTYFYNFPPQLPDEESTWEMQQQGQELLSKAGWVHYEVSAYCQSNYYSQHNLNYWQFGDYIGIGAGAHSKITQADGSVWRYWKVKSPRDYLACHKSMIAGERQLTKDELALEFMMNALRLQQEIPLTLFSARTGLKEQLIQPILIQAQSQGFLIVKNNVLSVTSLGKRFLNDLLALFLPSE